MSANYRSFCVVNWITSLERSAASLEELSPDYSWDAVVHNLGYRNGINSYEIVKFTINLLLIYFNFILCIALHIVQKIKNGFSDFSKICPFINHEGNNSQVGKQ